MGGQAYEGPRGQHFMIPCYELDLIGGGGPNDSPEDRTHPLWKPDIREPIPEAFVESLKIRQEQIATVWRNPHTKRVVVVKGSTRTRGYRQISDAEGSTGTDKERRVQCVFVAPGTTLRDLEEMIASENNNRKLTNTLVTARSCKNYLDRWGHDEATMTRCATVHGLTRGRLGILMTMLEGAGPELLRAMESSDPQERIGGQAAVNLAKLPHEQQAEVINAAKDEGVTVSSDTARQAVRVTKGQSTIPKRAELAALHKTLTESAANGASPQVDAATVIGWIIGKNEEPVWFPSQARKAKAKAADVLKGGKKAKKAKSKVRS